jgi:hypothetical protein
LRELFRVLLSRWATSLPSPLAALPAEIILALAAFRSERRRICSGLELYLAWVLALASLVCPCVLVIVDASSPENQLVETV